ncbi:NAD(P)H-binding protein [Allostreptomyces psammosilenae]|uniref:Uncharacterized protein YbjT (DUF2867 family) n=1 Tax=Allostreptomyces psammosilenae TaxID=1892865 RepID=A0A853ABH4_9ACTN|nr:NAD(P)H-binding protein [Allostreptomyces psammosilenae]NYI07722.1 uncharacterized protein YbjT (DUF2867 family) [Allostreptomyces psammosilenae]
MILVTGATGNIGRPLVHELAAKGVKVRALTRTPATARFPDGVEVCDSATPDLDGATALLLNLAGVVGPPGDLLRAAREAGVRRVVTVSSLVVVLDQEAKEGSTAALHRALEASVEADFPEWTHLRPGGFAANSLQWAGKLAAGDVIREPYPDARTSPIHEADIAAVAVRALLDDDLLGQALSLTGPEDLTTADQVAILGRVLGRPLRCERTSPEETKAEVMATNSWVSEEAVDSMLRFLAGTVGTPALVTEEVRRVLGRPARSYAEWAADHADAFRRV